MKDKTIKWQRSKGKGSEGLREEAPSDRKRAIEYLLEHPFAEKRAGHDGGWEFYLYRGHRASDRGASSDGRTSWTIDRIVADKFATQKNGVTSGAWISDLHICSIPHLITNAYSSEEEVIVSPHHNESERVVSLSSKYFNKIRKEWPGEFISLGQAIELENERREK